MIRDSQLMFEHDLAYRSPALTPNHVGSLSAHVDLTTYFEAADDLVGPALTLTQSAVTSKIDEIVRTVEEGPLGQEVSRLQTHLDEALAAMTELATKTHELQRRRSDVIRGDGKGPAIKQANDRLHVARADHVKAGELVAEVTSLLEAAEVRLKAAVKAAKIAAIEAATEQVQADLEASERAAALVIAEALAAVYVTSSVLRELDRQFNAARSPKSATLPPINVPVVTNRHQPRISVEPEANESDNDLGILGPVEILS